MKMSVQHIDKEKLQTVKNNLESIKTNLYTDFLYPIENKYQNIYAEDVWEGKKAEGFQESFENYWWPPTEESFGLSDVIKNDIDHMIAFIEDAIESTTDTDNASADNFQTQSGAPATPPADQSNPGNRDGSQFAGISGVSGELSNPPEVPANTNNTEISYVGDSNIISTSAPVFVGTNYNLSQEDINFLAYVAFKEQGSVEGAKIELSLIANRYEKYGRNYDNIVDYVKNSGWFSSDSTRNYRYPGDEYALAVESVLVDGNRYLPSDVDQHYSVSSVQRVTVNGVEIDKNDRSAYVPYETVIYENNSVSWTFVGFAPTNEWGVKGDPFGIS